MDVIAASRSWVVACHEAAHSIASRLMELPGCGEASVEAGNAHAVFSNNDGARSLVALLAGSACEHTLFGHHDEAGCRTDMQRVCQRLANSGYSYDELWTYTVDLVGKNLGLITFVAAELQRARQLDGPTIDRVFDAWVED